MDQLNHWKDWVGEIVGECVFPRYTFNVKQSSTGYTYLQAEFDETDTVTGKLERQFTRRWPISPEMTRSEIVATAFKCIVTSKEHEAREWFTYKNAAIYQPHYNVDDLLAVCGKREIRNA